MKLSKTEIIVAVVLGGLALDGIHALQTIIKEHFEARSTPEQTRQDQPFPNQPPAIEGMGPSAQDPTRSLTVEQQAYVDALIAKSRE
jgi:hypothetical protein